MSFINYLQLSDNYAARVSSFTNDEILRYVFIVMVM